MPSSVELDAIDKLALMPLTYWDTDSDDDIEDEPEPEEHSYFSGTACTIQFLRTRREDTRLSIRNIVIREDQQSLGDMASHARGLIPYCRENSKLYLKIKIDVWHALLLQRWPEDPQVIYRFSMLATVAKWLREASMLSSEGMPPGQCILRFQQSHICYSYFGTV
ncbi:hypothetical protein BU23DRAFT_36369 [Bimuria novae-zelandiae CBS 107.79]|uniref:Uncharacterized protein n=1 Tax=Bimuria novae-zelandiae CBS 107.79 TaxID=1447943 RepID=A0A6A5UL83_9PLEO|nr:hypothetical protein BU23DRAFT_36369 [Bimuria novae-zelandiae CBS 107.79]